MDDASCDSATALGHTITDEVRKEVRRFYDGYGLEERLEIFKKYHGYYGMG